MDASSSSFSKYDEGIALKGLCDAFGSAFSVEEIGSAYLTAGRDANMAAEVLYGLKECGLNGVSHAPEGECSSAKSKELVLENNSDKTIRPNKSRKASKPKKVSFSMGTVSGMMGRGYSKPASSLNDSSKAAKPSAKDEVRREMIVPNSVERNMAINNNDIEKFLFEMLGDGFLLDMDDIREVFGACGYDAKKSMEELLDKGKGVLGAVTVNPSDTCSEESYLSQDSILSKDFARSDGAVCRNGEELPCIDKKYNLSKEVLEALFIVPDLFEEVPKKALPRRAVKRTRAIGTPVTAPPADVVDPLPDILGSQRRAEDVVEDDNYLILRRAAKENWDAMKEYYQAALDAFLKGERDKAKYLLDEGKAYNEKAREADEKSAREIIKPRNEGIQNAVALDLHDHDSKNAIRLLKFHLRSLAGITSFQLTVILETENEAEDITKGARKRLVMKLLERENIEWIEEGNSRTISIQMDKIDPGNLSFAKKPQA